MKDFDFKNDKIYIVWDTDVAMSKSKTVAAAAVAIAGASVLAAYTTLSRRTNRRRKDLCAEIGLIPAVTTVLLRSPDRVSVTADGAPKLFQLPLRVTGGRSVCRRALSLVTNSEAEARSLFMLDLVRIVRKEDKTWIIVLNLPDSKWLPKPTALRAKFSKGLGRVVADAGTSVLALSRRPGQHRRSSSLLRAHSPIVPIVRSSRRLVFPPSPSSHRARIAHHRRGKDENEENGGGERRERRKRGEQREPSFSETD